MLEISAVTKTFDGFMAIQGMTLDVKVGEKHALIGPNGAGKTTSFNLITGHLRPDSGTIRLKQRDISGLPPHRIVKLGVARSFQRINIYPKLDVFQNVQVAFIAAAGRHFRLFTFGGELYRPEVETLLAAVGLADESETLAGLMSYGKQKQLELAIALAADPELLLLDEPTAGMSPQETAESIALIDRIVDERKLTLLFTEHDMDVVFTIADRISVLHHGAIIATDTPDRIRENEEVQQVYLGRSGHGAA